MDRRKITVLGGDKRSLALAKLLAEDGEDVTIYAFNEKEDTGGLKKAESLKEAINISEIIIGPLPFTSGDKKLNTPLYSEKLYIEDILKNMKKDQILLGGMIEDQWHEIAYEYYINIIDYFEREELQILNSIPTSEGAIQIAMEKMNITLHGSNVMVLGFGRIGKTLSKMLQGIGAKVYVEARSCSDISLIKSCNYNPVFLKEIEDYLPKMDLIINTIPSMILDRSRLEKMSKDTIIIDLASNPGGVDFKNAEKLGVETIWALGLPGKVAPISAANCIKETIYNIMHELEV